MEEQAKYHRGALSESKIFEERLKRASALMEEAGIDAVLLTKPQNMMHLVVIVMNACISLTS